MKVKDRPGSIRIEDCPNCKEHSLSIIDMPTTIHHQCIRCGYAIYKDHLGLDENDKAIIAKLTAKYPIGCATLKYHNSTQESIVSIPVQEMYEAFLEYISDNKDLIEYCKLSSFKDDKFIEQDLMILL